VCKSLNAETEQQQKEQSDAHEDDDDGTPDMSLTSEILELQRRIQQLNAELNEQRARVYIQSDC